MWSALWLLHPASCRRRRHVRLLRPRRRLPRRRGGSRRRVRCQSVLVLWRFLRPPLGLPRRARRRRLSAVSAALLAAESRAVGRADALQRCRATARLPLRCLARPKISDRRPLSLPAADSAGQRRTTNEVNASVHRRRCTREL